MSRAEKKITADSSSTGIGVAILYPELEHLQQNLVRSQEELSAMQKEIIDEQRKITAALGRYARLCKLQEFLKRRGFHMSVYDVQLLEILI